MKKQLIIIVYKINTEGMSRQQSEEQIRRLMDNYNFGDDIELKKHYIIKDIWLPTEDETDVKVIYPIENKSIEKNTEVDEIYKEMYKCIDDNPNSSIAREINKILRTVKIKNIEEL